MMLLVTGASGVGKSTVRALIAEELAPEVRTVELTQIAGPPTYERGWRQQAVEQVIQVALAEWMRGHARDRATASR
jgi:predicted ABC-type ATPase